MLHGMRHLVRGNSNRRHRAPVVMLRQQTHRALFRIVMVPVTRQLNFDAVQPRSIEKMTRQLVTTLRLDPIEVVRHPDARGGLRWSPKPSDSREPLVVSRGDLRAPTQERRQAVELDQTDRGREVVHDRPTAERLDLEFPPPVLHALRFLDAALLLQREAQIHRLSSRPGDARLTSVHHAAVAGDENLHRVERPDADIAKGPDGAIADSGSHRARRVLDEAQPTRTTEFCDLAHRGRVTPVMVQAHRLRPCGRRRGGDEAYRRYDDLIAGCPAKDFGRGEEPFRGARRRDHGLGGHATVTGELSLEFRDTSPAAKPVRFEHFAHGFEFVFA